MASPRNRKFDDDLDLDLDVELEAELADALDEPTEEQPLPEPAAPPVPPPPRFVVRPAVVTVLEIVGGGDLPSRAAAVAELVDRLAEADAPAEGEAEAASATAVTVHGAWLSLVTPASVDEVPAALERHGRLASAALVEGLKARLVLRGASAWGELAEGAGLLLGAALDEAHAWRTKVDHLGVLLAPSARLAASGAGAPLPARWTDDGDRVVLLWSDDPSAVERALAALGPFTEADAARCARTVAFLRSTPVFAGVPT